MGSLILVSLISFLAGWLVGRGPVAATITVPTRIDSAKWEELPSGWTRDVRGLTIYAMTQGGAAYWWVSRNGKTIIEGPSNNLDAAKLEAEREARELGA